MANSVQYSEIQCRRLGELLGISDKALVCVKSELEELANQFVELHGNFLRFPNDMQASMREIVKHGEKVIKAFYSLDKEEKEKLEGFANIIDEEEFGVWSAIDGLECLVKYCKAGIRTHGRPPELERKTYVHFLVAVYEKHCGRSAWDDVKATDKGAKYHGKFIDFVTTCFEPMVEKGIRPISKQTVYRMLSERNK